MKMAAGKDVVMTSSLKLVMKLTHKSVYILSYKFNVKIVKLNLYVIYTRTILI